MPAPELKHIDISLKEKEVTATAGRTDVVRYVEHQLTRHQETPKEYVSRQIAQLANISGVRALAAALSVVETSINVALKAPNAKFFVSLLVDGYYILDEPSRHPHPDRWYIVEGLMEFTLTIMVYVDASSKIWCSFGIFKPRFFEIKINKSATYWPIRPGLIAPIHTSHLTRFCKEA